MKAESRSYPTAVYCGDDSGWRCVFFFYYFVFCFVFCFVFFIFYLFFLFIFFINFFVLQSKHFPHPSFPFLFPHRFGAGTTAHARFGCDVGTFFDTETDGGIRFILFFFFFFFFYFFFIFFFFGIFIIF